MAKKHTSTDKDTSTVKSSAKKVLDDNTKGAYLGMLEELFYDLYEHRWRIYQMNFLRGLFFGFGSVLGGTLLVALTIALLSQFVDWFPIFGDFINGILDAVEQRKQ